MQALYRRKGISFGRNEAHARPEKLLFRPHCRRFIRPGAPSAVYFEWFLTIITSITTITSVASAKSEVDRKWNVMTSSPHVMSV